MDAALRARLTHPRVGCTDAHIQLFVENEIFHVADMQGLSDSDLEKASSSARVDVCLRSLVPSPHQLQGGQRGRATAAKSTSSASRRILQPPPLPKPPNPPPNPQRR